MRFLLYAGIILLAQVAHVIGTVWMILAAIGGRQRFWDIAEGYDLMFNPLSGGKAGEFISARANRDRKEGRRWACVLCRLLDKIDPGHCDRYQSTLPADAGATLKE
jgi:hypothetical protein